MFPNDTNNLQATVTLDSPITYQRVNENERTVSPQP